MRSLLARLHIDGFILAILAAVLVAALLPASGQAAEVASWVVSGAVALLFFLYGARLSPRESLQGLLHWRLHLVILGFTFVAFPLLGIALKPLATTILDEQLYLGVLYLTLVPSTVQSSIAFTSIARGNIAGAVVSASVSNLLGVFLTPLLVMALMTTTGGLHIDSRAILDICLQLLVPFALGQLARRWIGQWVLDNGAWLKFVDRGVVVAVVYTAFSAGMVEGIWARVGILDVLILIAGSIALVALMLWLTRVVSSWVGFSRGDRLAVQYCGTKKSLATGLPMAAIMFAGQPVGLLILPLMIFHQVQLMMCAAHASRRAHEPVD